MTTKQTKWSRFQSRCFLLKIIISSLSRRFFFLFLYVCKKKKKKWEWEQKSCISVFFLFCFVFQSLFVAPGYRTFMMQGWSWLEGGWGAEGRGALVCLCSGPALFNITQSFCTFCLKALCIMGEEGVYTRGCMCMWICDWFRWIFFPFKSQWRWCEKLFSFCRYTKLTLFPAEWNLKLNLKNLSILPSRWSLCVCHSSVVFIRSLSYIVAVIVFVITETQKLFMSKSYRRFYVQFIFGAISNMAPLFVSEPRFLFLIHRAVDINKVFNIKHRYGIFFFFWCRRLLMIRCAEHPPCAVDVFSCHLFSWHLFYLDPLLRILGDTANLCLPEHRTRAHPENK